MKIDKILFPTDFSTCGDDGLHYATSLARDNGAKLVIVHVEEPPMAYGAGEMYYGMPEPDSAALTKMLEEINPDDPNVECEHRLVSGHPADSIVELADEGKADLIVMGTHGRAGFSRLLLGSVAEAVVRKAKCPVLTFKTPEKADISS